MPPPGTAAPKFASFRPKPAATEQLQSVDKTANERKPKHLFQEEGKPHRSRSRRTVDGDERGHDYSRERRETLAKTSSRLEDEDHDQQHKSESLYVIDRKGDADNLLYGRLHRYELPQYYRHGYGNVVGLDSSCRIDRGKSDDNNVAFLSSPDQTAPSDSNHHGLQSKDWKLVREPRLVKPLPDAISVTREVDFMRIGSTKRQRLSSEQEASPTTSMKIGHLTAVRGLESRVSDQSGIDSDSDDPVDEPNQGEAEIRARNVELSKLTRSRPQNAQAWLDLIEHQEKMLTIGRSQKNFKMSVLERKALADVRISIFEQALKAVHTDRTHRIRLRAAQLHEVSHLLDGKRLVDKWQDALRQEPDAVELWTKYLDVVQASFASFRYEECRSTYLDSLSLIHQSRAPAMDCNALSLYVFVRLTSMMRQAGFVEHATASWQALLEFHLFRPSTIINASLEELVDSFEIFWDSDEPRIGEMGAHGWRNHDTHPEKWSPPHTQPLDALEDPTEPIDIFYSRERASAVAYKHPGRITDDYDNDDPFHVVLFSDIKPMLLSIPAKLQSSLLIQAYLFYQGLPALPDYGQSDRLCRWLSLDPFLHVDPMGSSTKTPLVQLGNTGKITIACHVQTTETLFSTYTEWKRLHEDADQVARSLALLVEAQPIDVPLAEHYVAFLATQASWTGSDPKKDVRTLLKKRPSCLRLYGAYGLMMSRRGEHEVLEQTFRSALRLAKNLPEEAQADAILLWRTWIWETLRLDRGDDARMLLLSIGNNAEETETNSETTDPLFVVEHCATLESMARRFISVDKISHAVLVWECLALLHYSSTASNRDLDGALGTYAQQELELERLGLKGSPDHEQLLQARCQLLLHHVEHARSYRPALIRHVLRSSIAAFPDNTILLEAYVKNAAQFSIEDRLQPSLSAESRHGLGEKEDRPSIIVLLSSVNKELQRLHSSTGTIHAVRTAFENAVESEQGRSCPVLWHQYLTFELVQGDNARSHARKVFYEGMMNLPWDKTFMMRAFGKPRPVVSTDELLKVFGVMEEKELRLFHDLRTLLSEKKKSTRPIA